MPTGTITVPTISGLGSRRFVMPVSIASDWVEICAEPNVADAEPGVLAGSVVANPSAITRAAQSWLWLAGLGTVAQVRLKYPTAASGTQNPVVQLFGRDRHGRAQRLVERGGGHEVTLAIDPANDVRDGSFSYTQPIEFDADGNAEVLAAIRMPLSGTGIAGAAIQARVK